MAHVVAWQLLEPERGHYLTRLLSGILVFVFGFRAPIILPLGPKSIYPFPQEFLNSLVKIFWAYASIRMLLGVLWA